MSKNPWYPNGTPFVVHVFGVGVTIMLLVTSLVSALAWIYPKVLQPWLYLLAATWAIAPPLWFWFEYHFLIVSNVDSKGLERYKFGAQLGAAIWAGVAISLVAYVNSDHFKSGDHLIEVATDGSEEQARSNP